MVATVARWIRHEAEPTKGSRFIATVAPAADEMAAREVLAALREEMPDATHHCSAWRIASPSIDRASDDGEPSGSAGRPILAQLQGRDLVNAVAIVTRYYGGTKLGVGGLVRAYGSAAGEALEHAELVPFVPTMRLQIIHGYPEGADVERVLNEFDAVIVDAAYASDVRRAVEVPVDRLDAMTDALRDATRGRARVQRIET
ncbi:MAG: YigZ family protein [Myxococcota bacterium]